MIYSIFASKHLLWEAYPQTAYRSPKSKNVFLKEKKDVSVEPDKPNITEHST